MTDDLVGKALAALRQKDFATAHLAVTEYASYNTLEFQHYLIKGLAEMALLNWELALETFKDATELFPHQPQLWFNLGVVQENLGSLQEAAQSLEFSINIKAEQGEACDHLSNIYRKLGFLKDAEDMAHRAYELGAPKASALNTLGLTLTKQGNFDAAHKTFHEALRLEPHNAEILSNLARLAVNQQNLPGAWPLFSAARTISDQPRFRYEEGMARLLSGDYITGWQLFEARLDLPGAQLPKASCPRYKGEPLFGKKLIILAEQGYGNTIMFCRYGRLLTEASAELYWVVQEPLHKLLAVNLPGTILSESDPLPEADYYIPIMSLPLATKRATPLDAPFAPYLRAPDGPQLPRASDSRPKVGVVWAGDPAHEYAEERALPLTTLKPLWKKSSALFYSFFKNADLTKTNEQPLIKLDHLMKDFAATAHLLMQLDYLITTDTATAHLAGALGLKTYLLLSYCPDFRWGQNGSSTAWYPSLTLIRQPNYGDWESVAVKLMENILSHDAT